MCRGLKHLGTVVYLPEGSGGFQSDMECDVYFCKSHVVLPSGMNMNMFHVVLERMTNVPVSSTPSAMKIEVVVSPDGEIIVSATARITR